MLQKCLTTTDYIVAILPIKEFSFIGLYKTFDRAKIFWIFTIVFYIAFPSICLMNMACAFIIILGKLISGILSMVWMAIKICKKIYDAIARIDLLDLYLSKGASLSLGIISMFVPYMFEIVLLCIWKKEPKFGFDKFYEPVMIFEEE